MKTNSNFKVLLLTAIVFVVSFSACKKNDQPVFTDATVINAGAVAADGCGWVIKIDGNNFSPVNLDQEYKINDLKVSIRYQTLSTKFECGWGQKISEVKLLDIKKK